MDSSESVMAFGKIFFFPKHESVPPLPIMNLLILKENAPVESLPAWRAACIDLELDAAGNSLNEAWDNLKDALTLYINMEIEAAGSSIKEAAKTITLKSFEESAQKKIYINLYRNAKMEYTMNSLESNQMGDPLEIEKRQIAKLESEIEPIRSIVNELKAA